ncbi:hypothetical protein [Priestia aryabhattai]|uniref:hypothetical protein n=1 Tax=Priestia aryabhattai TaxID=412384 RepID=UPI002E1C22E9|nr:hypothetical protein [Priestia aryabhattai]
MSARNIKTIEYTLRGMVKVQKSRKVSLLEMMLKVSEYQKWLEENRYIPHDHFDMVLNRVLEREFKQNKKRHAR